MNKLVEELDMLEELQEQTEDPVFDADKIERDMISAAQNAAQDPAEIAAKVYTMYRPEFLRRAAKLSSRGKTRVLEALVQYPLNGDVNFPNELEKEAYMFADSMVQSKFVLMMNIYKDSTEELIRAQDEFVFNQEEVEKLNKEGE